MKKIFSIFLTITLALGFASCSDNWENGAEENIGQGKVNLSSMGIDVSVAENVVDRASVDLSDFIITIVDSKGAVVKEWKYAEMEQVMVLNVGEYTLNVRSHNVKPAAFDEPYYTGSKTFSIVENEVTDLGVVTCKLSNIKVTILFDDRLKAKLTDDVTVTVVANSSSLTWTRNETRSGYFEAVDASTTLVATFHGTLVGESAPVSLQKSYTNAAGGNHYKITFKLRNTPDPDPDESGSVVMGSGEILDGSIETENVDGNVNVSEDIIPGTRPGQGGDEPPATDGITMTSESLSFDAPNPLVDGLPGVVLIHADAGISNLIVNITSDSEPFLQSVNEMLGTSFDLAYPGDIAEGLASLGFPVGNDVIGKKDIVFDITQFLPILAAFEGTHNFSISVTDMNHIQLTKTLTFIAR